MKNYFLIATFVVILIAIVLLTKRITYSAYTPIPVLVTKEDVAGFLPKSITDLEERFAKTKERAQKVIAEIIELPSDKRTYERIVGAFDDISFEMAITGGFLTIVHMTYTDENLRDTALRLMTELSAFSIDLISQNKMLYHVMKEYAENNRHQEDLTPVQIYLLQDILDSFERSGLHLPDAEQDHLKELNKECSAAINRFDAAISQDTTTRTFSLEELVGVSESTLQRLNKDVNGNYIVGLEYPIYFSIMDTCTVESTRRTLYAAFNNRAYPSNSDELKNILRLRQEIAQMVGYPDAASLLIADQMARTPDNVQNFIDRMTQLALEKAQEELGEILKHAGHIITLTPEGKINPWDMSYLINYYQKNYLHIDEEVISQYFPLEHTLAQLLKIYEDFFSITFIQCHHKGFWHEDVQLLAVYKDTELLGHVLMDLYPRPYKYSHACKISLITPQKSSVRAVPGLCAVIANFAKPLPHQPSLLRLNDVKTFFHEFGHALHMLFAATKYASHAGTNVATDFVELPSQMLELWMKQPQYLKMVSKHYETGEPLSDDFIKNIIASQNFGIGMFIRRQLMLTQLSLDTHRFNRYQDLDALQQKLFEKFLPEVAYSFDNHMYASFGHLSGYGPKYYGYLWARVFAEDIFSVIKENHYSPEIGKKYAASILTPGGSQEPSQLLRNFLGRDPQEITFFKNIGLIQ